MIRPTRAEVRALVAAFQFGGLAASGRSSTGFADAEEAGRPYRITFDRERDAEFFARAVEECYPGSSEREGPAVTISLGGAS